MDKLYLLGDVHGNWSKLRQSLKPVQQGNVITCGEFGWYPRGYQRTNTKCWPPNVDLPEGVNFFWLDGNHEDHAEIVSRGMMDADAPVDCDGWVYIPRGVVMEFNGLKFLCIGGGDTIPQDANRREREYRQAIRGGSTHTLPTWFKEETITPAQIEKALANAEAAGGIDVVLSHQPPARFSIPGIYPLEPVFQKSRCLLDAVLLNLEPKLWFASDMHRSCQGTLGNTQWRIIDGACPKSMGHADTIAELIELDENGEVI